MIQGTSTQNGNIVDYGAEGLTYPTNSFVFINNRMQNTLPNAIGINDPNGVAVVGNGNTFAPSITTLVNPPSANQLTGTSSGQISPDGTIFTAPNRHRYRGRYMDIGSNSQLSRANTRSFSMAIMCPAGEPRWK